MIRQILISAAVIGCTIALWIVFVPSARPMLDRLGVLSLFGIEATAPGPNAADTRRGGAVAVVVEPVTEGRVSDRVAAIGDGRALRTVNVRARVAGEVVEIGIADGTFVEQGSLILRLEDEAQRIAVERARLMLEDARDEAARLVRLETTGAVTEVSRRAADLALRTAELALREAEFALEQRRVLAPISGWAGVLDLAAGDSISAQDMVVTLTDRSQILLDFRVPERVVGQITPGMALEARPLATPGNVLAGQVQAVDNVVDPASRTLRVQGRLANDADKLRAGMAFEVVLRFQGEVLPSVDPLSVQWSADGSYVWVLRDDRAERVPVTIRQRSADAVLVEAALEIGEKVVVEGVQMLRPGAEVRIVAPQAALAGEAAAPL
ncbi:efflux RND transporter periplasmic adaptor subunit [Rhodovulum strictum]|uniref:Efflux RND transporter periplasmic adaptor subunit n=1 Tax=Rhodovulum strictum TaxID=58314 RepID=A0A844B775_9RHOB|nr:efflux RND transporter periplasmic adaptor subunit [Rhodovulum strictum]MRH21500.1 efflux RND transporter periplasmic adaptor subunit [Rhodovulum strictum]